MSDQASQSQSVIRFQEAYMEQEKLHKRKVRIIRSMLLVLFLALWELCTRLDMIDDFIFSSPSRVLFFLEDGAGWEYLFPYRNHAV